MRKPIRKKVGDFFVRGLRGGGFGGFRVLWFLSFFKGIKINRGKVGKMEYY